MIVVVGELTVPWEDNIDKRQYLDLVHEWLVVGGCGSVLLPDIHRVVCMRKCSSVVVVLLYSSAFSCCRRLAARRTGAHI